jgi:hypothetical protein
MRLVTIAAITFLLAGVSATASDWPGVAYVEVQAFAYNRRGFPDLPIVKNGRLSRTILKKQGVTLSSEQVKALLAAVTGERQRPETQIMCFDPRHAFVFFDTAKKPVAWVELCFECWGARAEPHPKGQVYDIDALAKLASDLKLPLVPPSEEIAQTLESIRKSSTQTPSASVSPTGTANAQTTPNP